MNINKRYLTIGLILYLILIVTVNLISCGEPFPKITFDNHTNQELTIFAAHVGKDGNVDGGFSQQGFVPSHSIGDIRITFLGDTWVNRIEARDQSGNVIFSHDYTMPDLKKINWSITIQQ